MAGQWQCVELFIPLFKPDKEPVPAAFLRDLEVGLAERFGGVTAFTRSPARGRWTNGQQVETDDVVIYEVMVANLDRRWWAALRTRLEKQLKQEEILIRAHAIERL